MHSEAMCHICKDYIGDGRDMNGKIVRGCRCAAKVAAFPDLLAALKMAALWPRWLPLQSLKQQVVAAAIAKATEAEGE